ncbi:polycystic kidney disease protein 1-like 2 [Plakobranchus ocellatus]|uniref:Polycystic kidney disease protein 1-like 2 n=1 Tax=Plakobranchus ocellatus TaxID=259542 RepID=A0AAV3ZI34_9GAST|nr:polycystic kidney disease protein 1-like 2 [Plakobranchus ocellatus]
MLRATHLFSTPTAILYPSFSPEFSLNSQYLALEDDLFQTFGTKSDVFNVRCDINNGDSNITISTDIWLNKAPTGGNCSIEPLVATATPSASPQWRVVCEGWEDSDNIKEFHFFSFFDDSEVVKEIDSFPVTGTDHVALDEQLILPVGPTYRDYHQDVWVSVRDSLNAVNSYRIGTFQVLPPTSETLESYVSDILDDPTSEFFMDLEVGDQRTVTEKASTVASMMTTIALAARDEYKACEVASNMIATGYGKYDQDRPTPFTVGEGECDTDTQFEADKKRDDRTKLRAHLIKVVDTLSYEDVWSIQNVAGMLSQVVSEPTEVSNDTQTRVLDILDIMIDSLSDATKMQFVPQEDVEKVIGTIYSALAGVQAASGIMGNYPSLDDLSQAQEDPQWKEYDASPTADDTESDVTNAKSYEEAMKLHSKHVHKKLNSGRAAAMASRCESLSTKLAKLFSSFAIPGQSLDTASYRGRGKIKKDFIETFLGQTVQVQSSSAAIVLPTDVVHLFPELPITLETAVTLQIQESTNFPDVYSEFATARLHGYSSFVKIDLLDEDGNQIQVMDTTSPIKLTIPNDPKAPQPENQLIENPLVTAWNRFMLHKTAVETSGSSVHVEFQISPDVQLLVVARHGDIPSPEDDKIDKVFIVPPTLPLQPDDVNPYVIVLTNEDIGDKIGDWYFGVRERNSSFINMPSPSTQEIKERYRTGEVLFEHNYNIKIWISGCYFYDTSITDWSSSGCTVSQETTAEKTVCLCNHLTTFTSGFVVAPNTIDWNYVFSNADFLSNPTLYITEIVIFIVFAIGFFLARRKDKHDSEQLGLAPLEDNRRQDKYYYEIQVSTGMRRGAGTDSNVYFILSGEEDETEERMFSDKKRPIFKKGMTNGFLMAVPRQVGRA